MRQYLVLILFLMPFVKGYGQELWKKKMIKLLPDVCYASRESHKSFVPPPLKLKAGSTKGAVILVEYVNFPDDAKAAFQYAVDVWKDLIYSPIPIHIKATWEKLASDVLGSCSPSGYYYNFNSTQIWNCYYPVALVEKMMGQEANLVSDYELEASFNSSFTNWYFGTDGATPDDKYDFVSTVMHELTHGLGFHGFFYSSRGRGGYGENDALGAAFDQYVIDKSDQALVDTRFYTNPSVKLYQALTSGRLAFNTKLAPDSLPRLYAPTNWDSGSSVYHLNDASYPYGDPNSLMTHAMDKGEAIHSPGPNTLAIMYDMGWKSISVKHKQLKDIELITGPINIEAQIESDYDLNRTELYFVYSTNKFLKSDSIPLQATSTATGFNAQFKPAQNTTVQYYFSAKDAKDRTFVFPSNAPTRYFSFTTGIDKTAPVVTHQPIKYLLSSYPSTKIDAEATDNIAVKSVKVEYFVNGGLLKEMMLVNDTADHYTGTLTFPEGSVHGGDIVSYRIAATDASSQSNIVRLPLSGYYTFKIEGIEAPVERYVANFDAANQDFIGSDFTITVPTGFDTPGLNSPHPYASPDADNMEYNFTTILKYPIVLNSKGNLTFDEIVLVEPGESGAKFGDPNFWDYVILEGSADGGKTWNPLTDGYDSNLKKSWFDLWNSSLTGTNSTAVPTKDLYTEHKIDMLANGNFKTGDVVLIRFRLFSDPYSHGWGWIIDNLSVQDLGTATTPVLLSSGEIKFFPNPATNTLSISVDAKSSIRNLTLKAYNTSGNLVYNRFFPVESGIFQIAVDVTDFTPGLYLFEVEPEKGKAITRKIQVL